MKIFFNAITLLLIMDPLGNIPPFLSVLKHVQPDRRRKVLVREIFFAYIVLLVFLFLGKYLLRLLSLQEETISIAGGIVLFLMYRFGPTLLLWGSLTLAWAVTAVILLSSTILYRLLRERGVIAIERLMGMLLVMLAVQMFINGVAKFMKP